MLPALEHGDVTRVPLRSPGSRRADRAGSLSSRARKGARAALMAAVTAADSPRRCRGRGSPWGAYPVTHMSGKAMFLPDCGRRHSERSQLSDHRVRPRRKARSRQCARALLPIGIAENLHGVVAGSRRVATSLHTHASSRPQAAHAMGAPGSNRLCRPGCSSSAKNRRQVRSFVGVRQSVDVGRIAARARQPGPMGLCEAGQTGGRVHMLTRCTRCSIGLCVSASLQRGKLESSRLRPAQA